MEEGRDWEEAGQVPRKGLADRACVHGQNKTHSLSHMPGQSLRGCSVLLITYHDLHI